jgi:hypothetical protein
VINRRQWLYGAGAYPHCVQTLPNALSPLPLDTFPHIAGNRRIILRQPIVHHSLKARVQKRKQLLRFLGGATACQNHRLRADHFVVGSCRVFYRHASSQT